MRNEFLFEAFGFIDDEYIAEAAVYRKSRKSAVWVRYAGIAAAVLLTAGVFYLVKSTVMRSNTSTEATSVADTVQPETGMEETVPMASQYVDPTKDSSLPEETIQGDPKRAENPIYGLVVFPDPLRTEIEKTENKNTVFTVTILVSRFDFVDLYLSEEYKKYESSKNAEVIQLYREEFIHWLNEVYMPQFTEQEWAAIEKQDSAGDIDLNSIFVEECWSKQQSEETQKEYEEAKKLAEEAEIVYANNTSTKHLVELYGEMAKAEVEREKERLSKLGYEFEIVPDPRIGDGEEIVADGENKYSIYSGFAVKGNLTGEQLSRFESEVKQNDVKHNYFFIWHTENGDVMIPGE